MLYSEYKVEMLKVVFKWIELKFQQKKNIKNYMQMRADRKAKSLVCACAWRLKVFHICVAEDSLVWFYFSFKFTQLLRACGIGFLWKCLLLRNINMCARCAAPASYLQCRRMGICWCWCGLYIWWYTARCSSLCLCVLWPEKCGEVKKTLSI